MSTRVLVVAALVAAVPASAALVETVCPQCGRKAPAFLAGQKCYHCGAQLPPAAPSAAPSPAPSAEPIPAITPARPFRTEAPRPAPRIAGMELAQPPVWYAARLPTASFTVRPPASHEKVEREVQIPADGLAPAGMARAGASTSIPLPNGPYAAISLVAEHSGADSAGLVYVEAKLADGSWWGRVMKVTAGSGGETLRVFWPPAPFAELRLSGLDKTGSFGQGAAVVKSVQVQP